MEHPIQGLMTTAMQNIRDMVDVNTIIGEAITSPDGTIIIPVSKVSFGFASGGSDFAAKSESEDKLFGGGSGAGISISPVAFLVVYGGQVKLLQISDLNTTADRIISLVPDVIDKIREMFKKQPEEIY